MQKNKGFLRMGEGPPEEIIPGLITLIIRPTCVGQRGGLAIGCNCLIRSASLWPRGCHLHKPVTDRGSSKIVELTFFHSGSHVLQIPSHAEPVGKSVKLR